MKVKEWILEADGSNLKEVLIQEGIDATRTFSNDVFEISTILGIEASR
jgi:DNA-directed RNA polymerase II subunit RPB1